MNVKIKEADWEALSSEFKGDLYRNASWKIMYATDASAYRSIPAAVARPKTTKDISILIEFARKNGVSLIPRAAGTSLAGQVVGEGIVVDVSKYLIHILELNEKERWVRVEPGVVLDELNLYLQPYGLFFAPETSTSNRCMIGGMVGNNACGAHSLLYGSTRDHTLSLKGFLSDSSLVEFSSLSTDEFDAKLQGQSLESKLYKQINETLCDQKNIRSIKEGYPDPRIERRNTGYAVDMLLNQAPFFS